MQGSTFPTWCRPARSPLTSISWRERTPISRSPMRPVTRTSVRSRRSRTPSPPCSTALNWMTNQPMRTACSPTSTAARSVWEDFLPVRASAPRIVAENKKALDLAPNDALVYASLGRQYLYAPKMFGGDVGKAIENFLKATQLDPRLRREFRLACYRLSQAWRRPEIPRRRCARLCSSIRVAPSRRRPRQARSDKTTLRVATKREPLNPSTLAGDAKELPGPEAWEKT